MAAQPVGVRPRTASGSGPPVASTVVLKAISASLRELEGDASLGKRIRATQELGRLLGTVTVGDPGVRRLCDGRGTQSLLVALMATCGEEREVTRNTILVKERA